MSNKVKGGLSLILLSICLTSVSALDCQFISDKFGINLDSFKFPINFDTIQDSPPTQNVFKVELDLCKSLKQDTSLPAEESCPQGTRICLKKINKHKGQSDRLLQVIPIAGQTENGDAVSMTFSHVPESDKSTLTLRGPTYNKIEQQADLDLTCDESISNGDSVPIFESYDELKGVLNLSWKHKTFCSKSGGDSGGGKKPSDEKDGEKESSSGWGFFSWFFFLIFALFAIYLFTGIYQNHKAGSRGIELLPHRHFWSEVPAMARDLFGNGIRLGRGGGGRGDYEAL